MAIRTLVLVITAIVLVGCATPSIEENFHSVTLNAQARLPNQKLAWLNTATQQQDAQGIVNDKLAQPLTVDNAVQIALLNNRRLQANYANLGIAVTDMQAASRFPDISVTLARLHEGSSRTIDRSVSFNLLSLLTRPIAQGIEQHNLAQARIEAVQEMLNLATETRQAWINTVAAKELVTAAEQHNKAAQTARNVVERLTQVGNLSRLDLLREQALHSDSQAELARSQQHLIQSQAQLTMLMGLWGDDSLYRLPAALEAVPDTVPITDLNEESALAQRLDVLAAEQNSERLAQSLTLMRRHRFVEVVDLGYQHNNTTGQPAEKGYDISLQIPIFTRNSNSKKAQLRYQQSLDHAADMRVRARAELQASYLNYRLTYDTARHYQQQVLPIRQQIAEEILLRYNGMLLSVLDLIANVRDQAQTQQAAIEAKRQFWLADSVLTAAMNGSTATFAPQTP